MLRYLTLLILVPINTMMAIDHSKNLGGLEISELQIDMDKSECYLIFEGEKAFILTGDGLQSFTVQLDKIEISKATINSEVALFKKNPFDHDPTKFLAEARKLYLYLINPIAKELKMRINILASEEYNMIPWNVLVDQKNQYLIHKHEVTIRKTLTKEKAPILKRNKVQLMILAPNFTGTLALKSKEERRRIIDVMKESNAEMSTCDILHISSHGVVNMDEWGTSGILLGNQSSLKSTEIADMCIEADLVFLNICEGAMKADGNQSIVDAFGTAGAGTTIGALWEVDDQMAAEFSSLFYKELVRGQRSSEALRNGLIKYRAKCELSNELHPLQWAGYQVYGENNPIVQSARYGLNKIFSMILSMFTSFSLISYYFGKKILARVRLYSLI